MQSGLNADVEPQPLALESPDVGESRRAVTWTPCPSVYWGTVDSTEQAKALLQECYARLALAITLLKALLPHVALLIEQEHARIGYAPMLVAFGNAVSGMMLEDMLVEETEGTDDGAALIREESIR